MTASLISGVIQKINTLVGGDMLQTISSNLIEKISAISEIESSIENIEKEFKMIQAVISKANKRLSNDPPYLAWLDGIRGIALKVEDTIDEYAYLLSQTAVSESYFKKSTGFIKNLESWNNIVTRIKKLESDFEKLKSRSDRYGIALPHVEESSSLNVIMNQHIMNYSYFIDEDEIVGNVEEIKVLTELVTNDRRECTIITICGMGGVGKTTIVNYVYKKQEAARNFHCYAWVSVSSTYAFDELLKRIIKQVLLQKERNVSLEIDNMDLRHLVEKLKIELRDKKYLIILDDVWQSDALLLYNIFPKNDQGSRVIITTRKENVASLADAKHQIKLNALSEEASWDLFCKKAFCTIPENRCPEILIRWAKKIVAKCQGLPLAIVVIGSLLACRDRKEQEWKCFYNQLSWELSSNPQIKDVLNLSINDLLPHLRSCFLYCGLFPEDADISSNWISKLWIAEGFVEEKGKDITMEEVAQGYIKELVYRSLIQVVEKTVYGRIKKFKMHDLLREICIATSKEERFSVMWDNPHQTLRFSEEARRISVQKGSDDIQPSSGSSTLRTFLLFDDNMSYSCIEDALKTFRLLRVLSLRSSKIKEVPEVIFELFNLHYLDLSYTEVSKISKSLGNLHKLQTLDLGFTGVKILPDELSKLKKLRHLYVVRVLDYTLQTFDVFAGVYVPISICNLKDLQILRCIEATRDLSGNLQKLKLLRVLHLWKVQQCFIPELCASVAMLPNLTYLALSAINIDEVLNLNFLDPLPDLEKLRLLGRLEKEILPQVFHSLHKLRDLALCWSGLKEDPLGSLAHMSNLVSLYLVRAYDGKLLRFRRDYFPNLKHLFLRDLMQLVQIEIESRTMINLYHLQLSGLQSLQCVPEGLPFLSSLQKITLQHMPQEFMENLSGDEGRLIQHVPNITFLF
ncbi:Disease resistance protein RPM1 [Rhynchospora pubera]|uniref:Disease resistance protein RPM1 n=1 Tax=Rhynchospora pubera TaxID=906938 RepID=A0AAV8G4S0_9POAL|nr:Disease resistance protein RPM1 [Rhynchospora pubera]